MLYYALLVGLAASAFHDKDAPVTAAKYVEFWKKGQGLNQTVFDEYFEANATAISSLFPERIFEGEEIKDELLRPYMEQAGEYKLKITRVISFENTHKMLPEQPSDSDLDLDSPCASPYAKGFLVRWESDMALFNDSNASTGLDIVVLSPEGKISSLVFFNAPEEEDTFQVGGDAVNFFHMTYKGPGGGYSGPPATGHHHDEQQSQVTNGDPSEEDENVPAPALPAVLFQWMRSLAALVAESVWNGSLWLSMGDRMAGILTAMQNATSAEEFGELLADAANMTVNGNETFDGKSEIVKHLSEMEWPLPPHYTPLFVPFTDWGKQGFVWSWIVPEGGNVTYRWATASEAENATKASEGKATNATCQAAARGLGIVTLDTAGKVERIEVFEF